ncbi:MAG TPA: hypothetical protein DCY86_05410 [Bdellovibrionales bacterium]|nr:hypothetical protein [Bdellovibrionales bacterium]
MFGFCRADYLGALVLSRIVLALVIICSWGMPRSGVGLGLWGFGQPFEFTSLLKVIVERFFGAK